MPSAAYVVGGVGEFGEFLRKFTWYCLWQTVAAYTYNCKKNCGLDPS